MLTYGHNKFDYVKLQKILHDKTADFQMKFLPGRVNVKLGKVTIDALKGRRSEDIGATGESPACTPRRLIPITCSKTSIQCWL